MGAHPQLPSLGRSTSSGGQQFGASICLLPNLCHLLKLILWKHERLELLPFKTWTRVLTTHVSCQPHIPSPAHTASAGLAMAPGHGPERTHLCPTATFS